MNLENIFGVSMLGVVTGLQYALLGVGIVLVYKASRFVNFAHGQLGTIAAVLVGKLVVENGWPYPIAVIVGLLAAGAVGAIVERTVIQRLFNASRLVLLVATIGVAQILFVGTLVGPLKLDTGLVARKGGFPIPFKGQWEIGSVIIRSSQLVTLVVAPMIAAGLYLFFAKTSIGKAIRAAASNADAARLAGISVKKVSLIVWVTAGVMSGLTAILLAPAASSLDVSNLGPSLLLRGLAAALLGGMTSLPVAFLSGIGIGVVEQSAYWHFPRGGTPDIAVFILILVGIFVRGKHLGATSRRGDDLLATAQSRPPLTERLKKSHVARNVGRYGWALLALFGIVLPMLPGFRQQSKALLLTFILVYAIIGVSLTLLTGWAGQASLGHFAFMGVGAYAAARADVAGFAVPGILVVAGLVTATAAVLVGLPALRFRGLFLGVSTLAFAFAARTWLFPKSFVTGQAGANAVATNARMPFSDQALESLQQFYYLAFIVLVIAVLALRSLRASGPGRALIAVRDNERAASAYGLNPSFVKISALAISGFLTGAAGAIWGLTQNTWTAEAFEPTLSLVMLSLTIVGGLGTLHGPILGAFAVFAWPYLIPNSNTTPIRAFSAGALLLIILLFMPGGIASLVEKIRQAILNLIARAPKKDEVVESEPLPVGSLGVASPALAFAAPSNGRDGDAARRVGPLEVRDVSITFGGLKALDGAALAVGEWEIVGLIGGNGAGKTTLFNCVNGHLKPGGGVVALFGDEVTGKPPMRRPHLGLARSFQDAHLYPGLTVLETVLVALDRLDRSGTFGSLIGAPWVRAGESRKRESAIGVLTRVGLAERADALTGELSTGMRRLCELATVMAAQPKLILLDEPTAGIAQREVEAFRPLLAGLRDQLGCSVLIIEHDVPLVMSLCDWIYALESGTVIAEGRPDDVRADPRVIASYLGTDAAAIERSGSTGAASSDGQSPPPAKTRRARTTKSAKRPAAKTKHTGAAAPDLQRVSRKARRS